jgi:hypothetical protein
MNLQLLGKFLDDMHTRFAIDTAEVKNQEDGVYHITAEVLQAPETGSVPPGEWKLKLGCPLILL